MDGNKRIFINICEYFLMIVTALQCNSIFLFSTSFMRINFSVINILWQLILIILLFLVFKAENINNKVIIFIIMLLVSIGSLFIYNLYIYPKFNKVLIVKLLIDPILLIFFFCSLNNKQFIESLFIKFENVILFLASLSLFFWALYNIRFPTNVTLFSNWGDSQEEVGYFGLSFFPAKSTTAKFFGMNLFRNAGVFAEPSIYAYVLIVALLIELFIRHNNKIFNYKILILLLTIISTISTTGILVAIPAYIYYVLINHNKGKMDVRLLIIILLPIIFIFLRIVFINKFGAAVNVNAGSSYNIRSDDITAALKVWSNHIFLGCGLDNTKDFINNMSPLRLAVSGVAPSDSAGFPVVLAQGGLLWGLFYIIPQIIISKFSSKLLGISIFLFIPFIFIASQGFYIYIMLLSYFYYFILNKHIKIIY